MIVNNMDALEVDCSKCVHEENIPLCDDCDYNIGITNSNSKIAGPCGQQNCWYGCTVCKYNNYRFYEE